MSYPDRSDRFYGLTDGTGIQAFALLVSDKPLPAFDDWPEKSKLLWTAT